MTQLERDFTHAFSQKRKSPIPFLTSKYIAFYPRVEVLEVKHLTQRNIRARKVLRVLQILSFFPCHKILAQTAQKKRCKACSSVKLAILFSMKLLVTRSGPPMQSLHAESEQSLLSLCNSMNLLYYITLKTSNIFFIPCIRRQIE